jgi:hypothetical protein
MTPRRVERAALAATVLLLHLLLWSAWPHQPARVRGSSSAAQAPLSVRLLTLDPAPAPRTKPQATTAPARSAAPRAAARPQQEVAIMAAPETGPAAAPPALAASSPRDLDLRLPSAVASPRSPSLREQTLTDPRSNTPRASVESRIAALNGPDRWEAEPIDATRTRWRRNGKCIEVHVARNAQIDPYNQSFSPTAKAVKPGCD